MARRVKNNIYLALGVGVVVLVLAMLLANSTGLIDFGFSTIGIGCANKPSYFNGDRIGSFAELRNLGFDYTDDQLEQMGFTEKSDGVWENTCGEMR